tara:strand:- start:1862 stop:3313 length:1452 start_codon:yes stop_codon:yes gene_type:complete
MTTLAAVVDQLKLNNEEERQRDSNLNQNIAHSRQVQEQLLSGLSKTFKEFFTAQQRQAEGDSLEEEKEEKKPEPVDTSPFLAAIKGIGASTDKFMKSGKFKAILGATLIGLLSMEGVQEFVRDKFVPVIKKFFDFLKDKVLPFLQENIDKIVIAGASIVALTALIKVGFMLTAAYLKIAKVWSAIATFAGLIKVATLSLATSFKKVALTLGGKFQTMLKALQTAAIFIRGAVIPALMTSLMTMGTTIMAALAPFLPIIVVVAAAIGAIVGIFFMIKKNLENLGIGDMGSVFGIVLGGLKDAVNHFLNIFVFIGKKLGAIGGTIAKALGFEVPEFLTNMADMEYFDTDNASKAVDAGQIKNRERLEKKIAETEEGVERDKLIEELKRVDDLIKERQGIDPPDRDFIDVKPKPTVEINETINENETAKLEQAGGGSMLNDMSTIINNSSNNSQSLSLVAEDPFDNQDQMEKYARGGYAIMRGKRG